MADKIHKGTFELIQNVNTSLVKSVIQDHGPISRIEIGRKTGLSNPTVSTIVASLIREGVVKETGKTVSTGGRPARLLKFNPKSGLLIGVDVGGTNMVGAVVDLDGNILTRKTLPTNTGEPGSTAIGQLAKVVSFLLNESGYALEKFEGIGLGVPGVINPAGREVQFAPGVGWENIDVGAIISHEFKLPVFVDNDSNCFVRGERWRGELQNAKSGVGISIGTGIGVGIMIEDQVYAGAHGAAGEVGYWLLGPSGSVAKPEGYGWFEKAYSGVGIAKRAIADLTQNSQLGGLLRAMVNNALSAITAKEIFAAASAGDEYCVDLVNESTKFLGIMVANLASLLDVETIVLGGGLSRAGDQILKPVTNVVNVLCPYPPQIRISSLREDANVLGAVAGVLAQRQNFVGFSQ